MPQRTIRFSDTAKKQIEEAARRGGFASPTAFIRYAVQQLLSTGTAQGDGTEERLGTNLEQLRRELVRLSRTQQALFAYIDTLGKTILTCMPEPPTDARPQAVTRARERYDRMLKSVARPFTVPRKNNSGRSARAGSGEPYRSSAVRFLGRSRSAWEFAVADPFSKGFESRAADGIRLPVR